MAIQARPKESPGNAHWKFLMFMAARRGDYRILRWLTRTNRVDPNWTNKRGSTPLHYSAKNGRMRATDVLLDAGADPRIKNNKGRTPDEYALAKMQKKNLIFRSLPNPRNVARYSTISGRLREVESRMS